MPNDPNRLKKGANRKMTNRYRYDTGNIIDQKNGEILTTRKAVNRLNKQEEKIKELTICQKPLFSRRQLHEENQTLRKENKRIKQSIRDAMESERTMIGKNTLKQLLEAIE